MDASETENESILPPQQPKFIPAPLPEYVTALDDEQAEVVLSKAYNPDSAGPTTVTLRASTVKDQIAVTNAMKNRMNYSENAARMLTRVITKIDGYIPQASPEFINNLRTQDFNRLQYALGRVDSPEDFLVLAEESSAPTAQETAAQAAAAEVDPFG